MLAKLANVPSTNFFLKDLLNRKHHIYMLHHSNVNKVFSKNIPITFGSYLHIRSLHKCPLSKHYKNSNGISNVGNIINAQYLCMRICPSSLIRLLLHDPDFEARKKHERKSPLSWKIEILRYRWEHQLE